MKKIQIQSNNQFNKQNNPIKIIQPKKKPIQITIPSRKYSQNVFGKLESFHIQQIIQYLPIETIFEMICVNRNYQREIITRKSSECYPINTKSSLSLFNIQTSFVQYSKLCSLFPLLSYFSVDLFTWKKLVETKAFGIANSTNASNCYKITNPFLLDEELYQNYFQKFHSKIVSLNLIVKTHEQMKILQHFNNLQSLEIHLYYSLTTLDTIIILNKLNELQKITFHLSSSLYSMIVPSLSYLSNKAIRLIYKINLFDKELSSDDFIPLNNSNETNNSIFVFQSNSIPMKMIDMVMNNQQIVLFPTSGNWYSFPYQIMRSKHLFPLFNLYYPFNVSFCQEKNLNENNQNKEIKEKKQEDDESVKMVDLTSFPINKILFNEIQVSENTLIFLNPITEYKLSPSSSLVILTN